MLGEMQIAKVKAGYYIVEVRGLTYEIDKFPDRSWHLFIYKGMKRVWINDFGSKRGCIQHIKDRITDC